MKILVQVLAFISFAAAAMAQTDLHIAGAKVGFPIAVPQMCDNASAYPVNKDIADVIVKDLQISGIFNVLNPSSYVEEPGKCNLNEVAFSDWTVVGAEGLVKGRLVNGANGIDYELILYDVNQQRPVVGKRYSADSSDFKRVGHKFANEILKYFTGEAGVFGTRIAYVSKVGRFKELFIMDMDGSGVKQLTNERGLAMSPSWSPQGDRILYTSFRTRRPELVVMSPDGGTGSQITNSTDVEIGGKFSNGGRGIITSLSQGSVSNIVEMDLKGRILRKLTSGGALDVSPSISPDGSQVVFCSDRGGGPQIYQMSSTGANPHRISFTGSSYCTSPAWSPKGDKIAFVCRDSGFHIFVTDANGGQAVRLTYAGNNEDPTWAPDGRSLAFSSNLGRGGARSIVIYSLLGGSAKQITFTKSEDSMPAWSPKID